ncbi:hypothetical protein DEO55_07065 [Klebsiella pneumoniae]|nr:hypothetical protein DEO52_21310 [Klebsiella pneumoniae]AWJ20396.1 hypothetical protein DEO55_07065 [Klebsiella pneumoniae]OZJ46682.1 hypothetical protein CEO98_19120 [Klebsiella pneumoniae]OZK44768.1 hypothetical protein CEO80_24280 [Klebsiella pneumoniae]OZL56723.1 hypothetical protein CEO60_24075 [Klebsiella pneumoniae]
MFLVGGKTPDQSVHLNLTTTTGVTVKIAGDCIVLIPDNDEIHELRKQLQQIKQAFIGLKGEVEG